MDSVIIGVTGGVGAGKSAVLSHLEEKGAFVLRADDVGREVMEPGGQCFDDVVSLFGPGILTEEHTINRATVAGLVFTEPALRTALNAIIHPAVRKEIIRRLSVEMEKGRMILVVETALLMEARYQEFCQEIWYVYAPEETRIQRVMADRGYSREKALDIIKNQASDEEFRAAATVVIDNSRGLSDTLAQVDRQLEELISRLLL